MQNKIKIIPEKIGGVVKITEDCQFNKIRAEKVIVDENVTARLFGSVNRVVLKRGAKLFLHGIIYGTIRNLGGEIYIYSHKM